MSITIERTEPPAGLPSEPYETKDGRLQMADPSIGPNRHEAQHAIYVGSREEAAANIERHGYSIWMKQPGKGRTLICAAKLKVTR